MLDAEAIETIEAIELFRTFNVRLPNGRDLWEVRQRMPLDVASQRLADGLIGRHLCGADHLMPGISAEKPGSARVADLTDFYAKAECFDEPPGPFDEKIFLVGLDAGE